ncbi:cytochrome P450 [Epithele typhae]|uniref:cytochrome P450 n=1 Tax=Epithele typhae TaxID=378194 RepID=UPI00200805B8|nr:cytochrome P450 [Epithele typhae]KAH9933151.1 cytochrome P450 [Epithele typhae]
MPPSASSLVALAVGVWALYKTYIKFIMPRPEDIIPAPPLHAWFLGHLPMVMGRQGWKQWSAWTEQYGTTFRLKFPVEGRMVVTHDPKVLHHVLVKDSDNFPKHISPSDDLKLLLGPGVLTTVGHQHKRQRKLLTPVFAASHLRNMTHIFYSVAHRVVEAMEKRIPTHETTEDLDVNGWMARTTLEMLGQAGLGYSFDNFLDDSTDEYGQSLKMFFPTLNSAVLIQLVTPVMSKYIPDWLSHALWRIFPNKNINHMMHIRDTMYRRSKEIILEKKLALERGDQALAHEVGEGKDIMSICLKANMSAADHEKMDDEEIIAQMSTFIIAGMDTTSNALSRILLLLAEHPDAQEKLRAEILEAQGVDRSDISYEDLIKLSACRYCSQGCHSYF